MSKTNYSLTNFIVHGAGQIVNLLAPFLVMPHVIKVCGIENWGTVGVATSLYVVICLLIEFGSNLVGVKEISTYRNSKNYLKQYIGVLYQYRMYSTIALLVVCSFIFIVLQSDAVFYFGLLSLIAQYFNPIWYFQGIEDFKTINKIIVVSKIIYVALVYVLVQKTADYVYVVGILGFVNIIVYGYYYRQIPKVFGHSANRLKIFVKKHLAIVFSNFAISFYSNAPVFIISALLGDFYTGIYKIIDLFVTVFRSYLGVFFNVSYPRFCYLLQKQWNEGVQYSRKMTCLNLLFLSIASLFLFLVVTFGLNYFPLNTTVKDGLLLSRYLFFLPLIIALNIPFYQTLLYFHKTQMIFVFSLVGALLMLVLGFLLTYIYHLEGVIMSIYFVEVFITGAMIIKGKPFLKK